MLFNKWVRENTKDVGLLNYHFLRGRPAYDKKGNVDIHKTREINKEAERIKDSLLGKDLTQKKENNSISKEDFQKAEKYFEKLRLDGKLAGL